jgi:hypothetical protein
MIAVWPMAEQFAITTQLAKLELLKMLAHKKNNQELVNSDLIHW